MVIGELYDGGPVKREEVSGPALCDNVIETPASPEFTVEGVKVGCHAAGEGDAAAA
jgi:hypothetical protein